MTYTSELITLEPRLIVSDVDAALAFYRDAFGAERLERFTDQSGRVVHAAMRLGRSVFTMTEAVAAWGLSSPDASSGPGVLLHLTVPDPDMTADRMLALGGSTVIEIEDRPYGKREGRVLDPFGHAWILSKTIEQLSNEEIGKRLKT
ncbi:VOC family protein [Hoeflea prorocentri]|uniref:VOC family protein n=1 Tax=Hoeflea prorocentri TaxID=1922333 RepID=A0A9X3ZJB0_9HYPH|nr:VOC family protein [Hoeflea prorocentri]MCY6382741.1 VOC family protein [Hoeflea prorocentri]MDA5400541.1 VOC family protein [Hoeflea prorocentri]